MTAPRTRTAQRSPAAAHRRWATTEEAASYGRFSLRALRDIVSRGFIRQYKAVGGLRYDLNEIDAHIEGRTKEGTYR